MFNLLLTKAKALRKFCCQNLLALCIFGLICGFISTETPALIPSQWVVIDGVSNPREREVVTSWIAEVQSVLNSSEFEQNPKSLETTYSSVYLRSNLIGAVSDVADIIALREPNLRAVKTPMALVGGTDSDYAFGGWTGDPFNEGDSSTSLTIGRAHLKRYFSQNQVEKSCAINTLAHEFAHLIVTDKKRILHALTDTGIAAPSQKVDAIGSYLIGTTAQCTWLENRGRLAPTTLTECVKIFGTVNFNSLRCNQFKNTDILQLRNDLPSPAKPSWEQ